MRILSSNRLIWTSNSITVGKRLLCVRILIVNIRIGSYGQVTVLPKGKDSRSTRRDQGCVLVRENPGSVKREEFVVLVV